MLTQRHQVIAASNDWKWLLATVAGGGAIIGLAALFSRRASAATLPQPPRRTPETTPTRVSSNGTRFVAQFEGFLPNLHNDPAGHCSIGFGHLVHLGRCNGSEPDEFKKGISQERGLELLAQELAEAATVVNRLVTVPLTQEQFDALASFVFNVGQGNFASSTLLKQLNQGDYVSVPAQLNRFVFGGGKKLPGLVRRREAEGRLFTTGKYGF